MKCNIYFTEFTDGDYANLEREGWGSEIGKLMGNLRFKPLETVDEALDKGKYRMVGTISIEAPEQAWGKLQNITEEGHPLQDRSMDVGDVVICGKEGRIVKGIGWGTLSAEQIKKFTAFDK